MTFALPEQPALSPDGREVVYVLATTDEATGNAMRSLWRVSATGGAARRLTRAARRRPAWSPDGRRRVPAHRRRRCLNGSALNGSAL